MSTDNVGEQSIVTLRHRYSPPRLSRKVLVFAHETGFAGRIELVPTDVRAPDSNIFRDNPPGKVPALVSDDGTFIGSALCCDYLDTLHRGRRLIPAEPPRALAGAATACAGRRHHGSRPWPAWWKSRAGGKPGSSRATSITRRRRSDPPSTPSGA
jgi:glutathione S-transferase